MSNFHFTLHTVIKLHNFKGNSLQYLNSYNPSLFIIRQYIMNKSALSATFVWEYKIAFNVHVVMAILTGLFRNIIICLHYSLSK